MVLDPFTSSRRKPHLCMKDSLDTLYMYICLRLFSRMAWHTRRRWRSCRMKNTETMIINTFHIGFDSDAQISCNRTYNCFWFDRRFLHARNGNLPSFRRRYFISTREIIFPFVFRFHRVKTTKRWMTEGLHLSILCLFKWNFNFYCSTSWVKSIYLNWELLNQYIHICSFPPILLFFLNETSRYMKKLILLILNLSSNMIFFIKKKKLLKLFSFKRFVRAD